MKLIFATTFDARNIDNWSGTPFYMSNGFMQEKVDLELIGGLKRHLPLYFKFIQLLKKFTGQRESPRFNIIAAKYYSAQVEKLLSHSTSQAIISPQVNPIAYLNSKIPIVLWTDALYASLLGFYSDFTHHSPSSIAQGNKITQECLSRCKLTIFSSEWAARTAIEIYGVHKEKVKVVPFGANIHCEYTHADIQQIIKNRSKKIIKLLFIGKHWQRKGGDIVFEVAKKLNMLGCKVELNFVGSYPPKHVVIPPFVKCHGFISKRTQEGTDKMAHLLRESHFLFVPSRAEAYGIVFCEANAFGLPCLTSQVGGIPTIVKDHINGKTFSLETTTENYCEYILDLMQNDSRYEELALSAFNEYKIRLNWKGATQSVKKLLLETL